MTRHNSPIDDLGKPVQQAISHPWFERLSRLGYAAKGLVYFVIGLLALQAAIGPGGRTTDQNGALQAIVTQPFGKFLLAIVALGLVGYVLWRVVQTVVDPEHAGERPDAKQIAQRLGYAFSAIAYMGLAVTAVKLVLGTNEGGHNATQDWTARFLAQPFGQWLVGTAGVVAITVGISYFYEAYKAKFRRHLNLGAISPQQQKWAIKLGRFGIAARGVVFCIIGFFFIVAAVRSNPDEAKGLGDVLATLSQQPFGPWLLGTVALGLMAYSVYSLVEARYRKLTNS